MVKRLSSDLFPAGDISNVDKFAHTLHRRLCGLINRPRLREYAAFLQQDEAWYENVVAGQSDKMPCPDDQVLAGYTQAANPLDRLSLPKPKKKKAPRKDLGAKIGLK